MSISRRSIIVNSVAGAVLAPAVLRISKVRAAEFSMKWGNDNADSHPVNIRAKEAVAAISKETNGKVDIQVFGNNVLGGDTDMLSQLRTGALEFFSLSPLILQTLVPNAAINGIGFAWPGYDKVWPAMDGELGAYIRAQIAKSGIHTFDKMWDNGFRQITSSTKPIKSAADLDGFKIRVPPSPLWTSMFKDLGAAPAPLNFAEVYSALQTKVFEGQENPLAIIETAKLYEVQKYLCKSNHMWDGYWQHANAKVWAGLPKEIQTVISKHIDASGIQQREDIAKLSTSLEAVLVQKGMEVVPVDGASMRAKLQSAGFYADWKSKFGPEAWGLLEKYAGKIS